MKNVEMKLRAFKILTVVAFITTGTLVSCVGDSNSPGLEYMPDMYRAPSVEGQVDYGEVRGMADTAALNMVERKFSYLAPQGTIPYTLSGDMFLAPYRHGAPMGIGASHGLFEVREDSTGLVNARLDVNPIAYSEQVAKEGEELYGRFCIHCHGKAGDGQGTVITNSNGKFPPPPAYKKDMPAGEMYYIITYGRNTMGAHGSQVNPVERWKIVYHIDKLVGRGPGQAPASDSLNIAVGLDSLTAAPALPK